MNMVPDIAIGWTGLPTYGARLIRHFTDRYSGNVEVLATRAAVPFKDLEEELGRKVVWLTENAARTWTDLGMSRPQIFVHTAWNVPAFNSLAREVSANGGHVVMLIDNRFKGTVRQHLGGLYFRLARKPWLSAAIVPGASARQFSRLLGFSSQRIFEGQYGIDLAKYNSTPSLPERERVFMFVGQLIHRKGLDTLMRAWQSLPAGHSWKLRVFGVGPMETLVRNASNVEYQGFLQPSELAGEYRKSRVLILPSREDHFPLVTLEAAASGCGLLVSDAVGTCSELKRVSNVRVFKAGEDVDLSNAIQYFMALKDREWLEVEKESKAASSRFGVDRFAGAMNACLDALGSTAQ